MILLTLPEQFSLVNGERAFARSVDKGSEDVKPVL